MSDSSVIDTLQHLYALVRESEREMAAKFGLNLTDYRALAMLARYGPMTSGKFAQDLGATAATTTAITNRLEQQQYVLRQRDEDDRRQVVISAAPASSKKILDLLSPLASDLDSYLQELPAEQRAVVAGFLDVAQHLMHAHLQEFSKKETR